MACTKVQKVHFGTHMLSKDWWDNARQRFEASGTEITWVVFRNEFLENYFSEDVYGTKEIEFLKLKQWNMTMAEYAVKFEALVKFCPYYNIDDVKTSKCLKFENGMRPQIRQGIGYQQIRRYPEMVNKSRTYNEDNRKLQVRRRQVRDGLSLLSGATNVVSWDIMLMNVRVLRQSVSNVERRAIRLLIEGVMG